MNAEIEAQLTQLGRGLPRPHPGATARARAAVLAAAPRPQKRLMRWLPTAAMFAAAATALVVLLIAAPSRSPKERPAAGHRVGAGPWLIIPDGWAAVSGTYTTPCCNGGVTRVLRVSNAPALPAFATDQGGGGAAAALTARQMIIEVTTAPPAPRLRWPAARLPVRVSPADFRLPYEGQATAVLAIRNVVIGGVPTTIRVGIDPRPQVITARPALPAYGPQLIAQANRVLATLRVTGASVTPVHAWVTGIRRGTPRAPAAYAWAATVPYRDPPVRVPLTTIATLGPRDVIILARLGARGSGYTAYSHLPLALREARHFRCCDGQPYKRWIHQYELFANATSRSLLVSVYSRYPLTKAQRAAVQAQLGRLRVGTTRGVAAGRLGWSH